ncbi:hypothetical protein HO173_010628 [Letharia columbiana]|uniref:Uncharacterized protein n=1 Tax=Letharia columbiana TaxID=112416 RepID=A0A8H6FMA3_9LECA|nr:uncharacterized protein HO173_010628 [Letharia columbiana]KAF6231128.1 hypothetical protein HO173_010628 [Letharia columbiana]
MFEDLKVLASAVSAASEPAALAAAESARRAHPVREPPNNQIKSYNIWLTKRFPVPFPTAMLACLLLLFAIKVGEAHI